MFLQEPNVAASADGQTGRLMFTCSSAWQSSFAVQSPGFAKLINDAEAGTGAEVQEYMLKLNVETLLTGCFAFL